MKQALLDRAREKVPADYHFDSRVDDVSRVDNVLFPADASLKKGMYREHPDTYELGLPLRVDLPGGCEQLVSICPIISEDLEVANRAVPREAYKRADKLRYHDYGYMLEMDEPPSPDDVFHYRLFPKPYRKTGPAPSPPESLIEILQARGRIKAAARIAELISICEEDEDEHYEMGSLGAIVSFFLSIPKAKTTSNISLSPSGTFAASWFGPDGKIHIAMEFLGDNVLLIRRVNGRARALRMDPREAQRHLP